MSQINNSESGESNKYDFYFSKTFKEMRDVKDNIIDEADIYKEKLQTASKEKLIDIAIERHKNYEYEMTLRFRKVLENSELEDRIKILETTIANNETLYQQELAKHTNNCLILSAVLGFLIVCEVVSIALRKYKNKIKKETIEELQNESIIKISK